jgi:ferredoxin
VQEYTLNTFRPMGLLRRAAGMRPRDELPVLPEGPTTPSPPSRGPAPVFADLARRAALGEGGAALHADDKSTDVAAYAARAMANGRNVELSGEGRNQASDGTEFWGPVDNESSRSKAVGQVLTIDQWECITCGTCEENTTRVFEVPSDDKARVLAQDGPMDLIQDAIEACPVTCIHWIDVEEVESHHSCGGHDST